MNAVSSILDVLNNTNGKTASNASKSSTASDFGSALRSIVNTAAGVSSNSAGSSAQSSTTVSYATVQDLYQQPGVVGNTNNDPSLFGGYSNTKEHILNSNLDAATQQAYLSLLNQSNENIDFWTAFAGSSNYQKDVDPMIDAAIDAGLKSGSTYNTSDYQKFAAAYQNYFPGENLTPPSGYEVPLMSSAQQNIAANDAGSAANMTDWYTQNAGSGPWNGNLMALYGKVIA
ncbi:MAG: hypothetical protein M0022_06015 [Desulfobacteraceae bacterium]|nr:hypothetical protein [Desulfobacteraceae bacterium]